MTGARHNLANSAMFESEIEIMDLRDRGASADAIAQQLGKRPSYVRSIISRFTVTNHNRFDAMVARGSRRCSARSSANHPERFPAACTHLERADR